MYVGSRALKVSPYGIHGYHWIIAVVLGFLTWVVCFVAKFIPDRWFPQLGQKRRDPLDHHEVNVLNFRRERSKSLSLRQPGSVNKDSSVRVPSIH